MKVSSVHCALLVRDLVQKINQRDLVFDLVIGLSTGGLVAAAFVAKKLQGIDSTRVIGVPVSKQNRIYKIDDRYVAIGDIEGWQILVIDEASNSGNLLHGAKQDLYERGAAHVTTASLVASTQGMLPDLYAATCCGEPPKFFWE